jgi:hypothetical protein
MALDVTAEDGSSGAIRTSEGVYKTVNGIIPAGILGLRGTLVISAAGKLLTVVPDNARRQTVTVESVSATGVKDTAGIQYKILADTPAYTASQKSTFGAAFIDIAAGMTVTLYYNGEGSINCIYINTTKSTAAYVVGTATSGMLNSLTGGETGYKIYKNGVPATSADLKTYDVLTYDKSAKIIYASDFRLTGCYESCWPNMENPSKITVIGHEFPVLPSAVESLSRFKVGQVITFLFTSDLQVAGAEAYIAASEAIGVVQSGITTTAATVKLLNGLTLSGNPQMSYDTASKMSGELVKVSSSAAGKIAIVKVNASDVSGALDINKMTLGTHAVSPAVKIFERAGKGPLVQISLSELPQITFAASKVLYAGTDSSGNVTTLILDDVTGDRYEYGILLKSEEIIRRIEIVDDETIIYETYGTLLSLKNKANPAGTTKMLAYGYFLDNKPGGVIINSEDQKVEATMVLNEITDVKRSSFYVRDDTTYLMVDGVEYPVSDNVQCYNSLTDTWFKTLNDARAFSETLKVYFDRSPAEGGKIRVVIAG